MGNCHRRGRIRLQVVDGEGLNVSNLFGMEWTWNVGHSPCFRAFALSSSFEGSGLDEAAAAVLAASDMMKRLIGVQARSKAPSDAIALRSNRMLSSSWS